MGLTRRSAFTASVEIILISMLVSPSQGAVRLAGGSRVSEGRLEVTYNNQWGTVCDDNFDINEAKTACRSLGCTGRVPVVRPSAHYGQGTGPIWLDDLNCTGNERDVFQCSHRGVGNHNCDHSEDVGLDCSPPTQIRLVGGGWPSAGRVEVNIGGRWGTVCGHRFGPSDAKVVCRMLGYNGSTPTSRGSSYYGRGSNLIWLDNLQYTGNETDLLQCLLSDQIGKHNCSHSDDVGVDQIGKHNCSHSDDVGVDCHVSHPFDNEIRLMNKTRSWEGRVEVYHGGQWGTVCDNSFGVYEAKVVCGMLGYTYSGSQNPSTNGSAYYGIGSGPIWLDKVNCLGNESSIFNCKHSPLGFHGCGHLQDVGVNCRPTSGPSRVSLSGPLYHITDGTKPLTLNCTAEEFTPSVSFTWGGHSFTNSVTSADFETLTFTPTISDDGKYVRCTVRNTEKTSLVVSRIYVLRLKYPPSTAPVITGFWDGDSVMEGSNVTLTCSITGGKPAVTSVTISCGGQGRTLSSSGNQAVGGTTPSNNITIAFLRAEDDGTKCQCSGNWTPQPNLYLLQSSVTIHVIPAIEPNVTSLTLNGAQHTLTVNASDNTSVTLSCAASGRPKPSIRVVRVDTGQPLEVDTSHTSGQDENVQQYTLTTSARCQDAAIYRCEASNWKGHNEKNVTLYVNCAPGFAQMNNLSTPENQPLLIELEPQTDLPKATIQLMAYPAPVLVHVAFVGPYITSDNTGHQEEDIDSNSFLLLCEASDVLYDQVCSISVLNVKVLDAGVYRLTVENMAGDFSFHVKLNVHAVTEKDDDDSSKTRMFIYIGAGAGGCVVLIIVVVVVVVFIRRHKNARPIYDSPALKTQVNNPGYTDLSMTQISPRVQCEEEVYDNAALDSDNCRENPYVNVTVVSDSNGATGGKGRMLSEETFGGDAVYENTVLR